MSKGYTTPTLVAQEMGVAFTTEQAIECDGLIGEAEAYVDRYTGRAWLVSSPVTDALHRVLGPLLYLDQAPVAAVTALAVRSPAVGAQWIDLVAGSGFELIDPSRGIVSLSAYPLTDVVVGTVAAPDGYLARVTYAVADPLPLPLDVQTATTQIVADRMLPRIDPLGGIAQSVSVGQGDVTLTYRDPSAGGATAGDQAIRATAQAILDAYRGVVLV